MYLTTHRVESFEDSNRRAVHSYLYMHRERVELDPVTFEEITVRNPGGELVERDDATPPRPGGNAVLSYLDIVTQDDIGLGALQKQLEEFAYEVSAPELPSTLKRGPIWLKFHVPTPTYLAEQNAVAEYEELSARAVDMLRRWREGRG